MTTPLQPFLPYGRQSIDEDDIAAVVRVLESDFLTTGPIVDAFEGKMAEITRARHAVACANGTAALHLASLALGLGPGDAVIVPAITFLATANAPRLTGAHVVFADVDPETGLMTAETFRAALAQARARDGMTPRALFPVHLAGQTVDLGEIAAEAREAGLSIVEDACHALGTETAAFGPVGATAVSDMTVFSFHPVKAVAMGEGGIVTTNDDGYAEKLRRFRNHGMVHDTERFECRDMAVSPSGAPNPWYYEMPEIGLNYRASDIHCALGLSQLAKLSEFIARRRALAARYDTLLAPLAPLIRPLTRVPGCRPAWHLYAVLIDFARLPLDRASLMARLREAGIGTQVHYVPVHHQPYYRRLAPDLVLEGADGYYARTLSLPLFPAMEDEDVDRTVGALSAAVAGAAAEPLPAAAI